MRTDTSSWHHTAVLLLLLVMSGTLRLSLISLGPFHADCLSLATNAQHTLATGQLLPLFGSGYPLTVLLGAASVAVSRWAGIADPVTAVNLMSVIFSSLSVLALYEAARRLFDPLSALLSALLWSVLPTFLALSTYGTSHTTALFFLFTAIAAMLSPMRKEGPVYAAICLGLMGGARLQDLILVAPAMSFLFITSSSTRKNQGRALLSLWSLAGIIILTLHLPFLLHQEHHGYWEQFQRFYRAGVSKNFEGLFSASLLYSFKEMLFNLLPVGALLAAAGLITLLFKDRRTLGFLLLWGLVPLAFYGNLETTVPRFLVISLAPLVLASGYSLARCFRYPSVLLRGCGLGILGVTMTLMLQQMYPALDFRHSHALLPDFGRYVGRMTPPEAVIITSDEGLFIDHYGHRQTIRRPRALDEFLPSELRLFQQETDGLLSEGIPLYITGTGLYSYDPQGQLRDMMFARYRLTLIGGQICEDWHQGEHQLRLGRERLFKIEARTSADTRVEGH